MAAMACFEVRICFQPERATRHSDLRGCESKSAVVDVSVDGAVRRSEGKPKTWRMRRKNATLHAPM